MRTSMKSFALCAPNSRFVSMVINPFPCRTTYSLFFDESCHFKNKINPMLGDLFEDGSVVLRLREVKQ